jgi:hypothetical protein
MRHLVLLCFVLLSATVALGQTVSFPTAGFTYVTEGTTASFSPLVNHTSTPVASVQVRVVSGSTAVAGTDYTDPGFPLSVTLPANSTAGTFNVVIQNNGTAQGTRTLVLELFNPTGVTLGTTTRFTIYIGDDDQTVPVATNTIQLSKIGGWAIPTGSGDGAEIVAYHPGTQRLVVLSTSDKKIYTLNASNPASLTLDQTIDLSGTGVTTGINSCAIHGNLLAVAVEGATSPQDNGRIRFYDMTDIPSGLKKEVTVDAMPDMVTFTPDGTKLLVANEGEANNYNTGNTDPNGTVSIIPIPTDITTLMQAQVQQVSLTGYNGTEATLRAAGVRITSPQSSAAATNFEPEYIAVSADSRYAYVSLQDNNALLTIDMQSFPSVSTNVTSFGLISYNTSTNSIDPSNTATGPAYRPFSAPDLFGCPMPDAIGTFVDGGTSYVVTANEGDARSYEETNRYGAGGASNLRSRLSSTPDSAARFQGNVLGRLNVINTDADGNGDGIADRVVAFGSRSISIYSVNNGTGAATRVWDSEDDFERITLADPTFGALYNCSNGNNTLKDRSDDKGPEPEGLTVATLGGKRYVFVTLERIGGIMTYDITNPAAPIFVNYVNSRTTASVGGDRGPEGIMVIPGASSPTGQTLVVTGNETSRTVAVFGVSGITSTERTSLAGTEAGFRVVSSPNPANEWATLSVRGATPGLVEIELIDLAGRSHLGQIVSVNAEGEAQVQLPTSTLSAGLYTVKASQRGVSAVSKLVVQH